MGVHNVTKGLDLPITGGPEQTIHEGHAVSSVAVMAADFVGMKPRLMVKVGDTVKRGQKLFEDRKAAGVFHCAPGAGRVAAVNRGDFRALESVVIELNEAERQGHDDPTIYQSFESYSGKKVESLSRDDVVALLVESGLWTTIRQRPFGRVPTPDAEPPRSLFVNAMDTNPLAADPDVVMKGREDDFARGLAAVAKLTDGKTFLCKKAGSTITAGGTKGITVEEFSGPHPAGTVGFHIHTLDPVNRERRAWYLSYADVIHIGRLFGSGKLDVERIISLAGPQVEKPRLLRTRIGANLDELTARELVSGDNRVISGSVLFGDVASGERLGYLGRYHLQVSVLREGRERVFLGWLTPGAEVFSVTGSYVSRLMPDKKFAFSTAINGSHRHMVPLGLYESVFPFDIMPTFLLRAIAMDDLEHAEKLGVLELDEEDMGLCTFVDPGKNDYGHDLRRNLDTIWKEG